MDIKTASPTTVPEPVRETCPPSILAKVRQFDEQADAYQSGDYSEAQLRIDFINPMLEALGWDVNNRQSHAEAYREVVYEDALKIGGATKAPDYGFYIGGRAAGGGRKFFLEAKRPSVAIGVRNEPAFQLRRYAYSAELPLSILTNFKDFIVYDTRIKPTAKDGAKIAAILTIHYTEYAQRWDEIASIFSREAILRGAFDKFAQGKRKRGMEPLGESFLKDIEEWRKQLAQAIAANNELTAEDLNFAVQRTIDRILFLRICEDRGIEPTGNLMQLLNGNKAYARLGEIFRKADDRYNSGIFHFPSPLGRKPDSDRTEAPDDLTLGLNIPDETIKPIIRGLYDAPGLFTSYAFAVIPPEILGQVYERFLGKVITTPSEHKVKIEEKPEVRKAGGVYYTPAYIVEYIVRNTVGKLLEGKSPKEAAKLRVLDPASGSGSFLIGAYQFLLDWHLRWYLDNDPETHCKGKNPPLMRIAAPSFADENGESTLKREGPRDYRLTTQKRKEILLNCIYGVDIDSQAVEVTKLSLLLKVLEGESRESVQALFRFQHQRVLPDLGKNIKCGNSLIGDDFDDSELSDQERRKINKFNWEKAFPKIFKDGGFDAVIGNPPYIPPETMSDWERIYYRASFPELLRKFDSSVVFILAMLRHLRSLGYLGYISSLTWQTGENFQKLREVIFTRAGLTTLINLPFDTFKDAYVDAGVYIIASRPVQEYAIYRFSKKANATTLEGLPFAIVKSASVQAPDYKVILDETASSLFARIAHASRTAPLGDLTISAQGLAAGRFKPARANGVDTIPLLTKGQVYRYDLKVEDTKPVSLEKHGSLSRFYQAEPKILIRRVVNRQDRLVCAFTKARLLFKKDVNPFIPVAGAPNAMYLLGIMNSRLFSYLYVSTSSIATKDDFRQTTLAELRRLPIRNIDVSSKSDKTAHDKMVKLVDRMLDLHKKLPSAKSPLEKERLQRDIESTDRQIDALVYELYGLTDDEIRIVEQQT